MGSTGVGGMARGGGAVWVGSGGEVRRTGIVGGMITPPVDVNGVGRPG
jgi:hypothetical protein